ncbi:hypothetical protein SLA2020_244970 [Shorea laevis]
MGFHFLLIIAFIHLAVAGSCHASLPGEIYWKSVFPNTPIPKNLQDLLQPESKDNLFKVANANEQPSSFLYSLQAGYRTAYFFETDLRPGTQTKIPRLMKTTNKATFLPREVANSIPFSSDKFPEILEHFSVEPKSKEAKVMKRTIDDCEGAAIKGEDKYCVTSFESLVDSSVSSLGKKIQVLPNEADKQTKTKDFTIGEGVQNMGEKQVVCHKTYYPYAVFLCHSFEKTDTYSVPLVGSDGTKAKAVAICHKDTSAWNPKHRAFKQLNVKAGTVPICHFLTTETIVWVPK